MEIRFTPSEDPKSPWTKEQSKALKNELTKMEWKTVLLTDGSLTAYSSKEDFKDKLQKLEQALEAI